MNPIFFVLFTLSVAVMLFTSPQAVVSAALTGAEKAVSLTFSMAAIYALWLGVTKVAEKAGVTDKLSVFLRKPVKFLFGNVSKEAEKNISVNLSANLLGMGGIATPAGIKAAAELDKTNDVFAMNVLFVLAATSIQLLPSSVISLRSSVGSTSPSDVIIPTLITTTITTALAVFTVRLIYKKKKK